MSLNLVSPGVKVREVDLTIGNISGAQEPVSYTHLRAHET